MRHAVGAHIAHHELVRQTKLGGQPSVPRHGRKPRQIRPVAGHADLGDVDAAPDPVVAKGVGDGDHGRGEAVKKQLQPFQRVQHPGFLRSSYSADRFRPDIAQFKNKRLTLRKPQGPSSIASEKLRRGADDQIDPADEHPREKGSYHEADVIQDTLKAALVAGHVAPDPDHADAVKGFALPKPVAVAVKYRPLGVGAQVITVTRCPAATHSRLCS